MCIIGERRADGSARAAHAFDPVAGAAAVAGDQLASALGVRIGNPEMVRRLRRVRAGREARKGGGRQDGKAHRSRKTAPLRARFPLGNKVECLSFVCFEGEQAEMVQP